MVIITKDIVSILRTFFASAGHDKVFVLTDANTRDKCLPLVAPALEAFGAEYITIDAGDMKKNIEQVALIWEALSSRGASRNSLLVNLGGGMVTDLGGFAGATFKRGIHNLNIPTTLMASVDAAVGGKTGINFQGLKNEIGAFYQPDCVMIDCVFLRTSDRDNILSGYAEMLKHGLISDHQTYTDIIAFEVDSKTLDMERLSDLVRVSIAVKERIVAADPREKGIRKALNFGHTIGHALESLSFAKNSPLPHGHAVAAGMVCELYLSHKVCDFPVDILRQVTNFVKETYPSFLIGCNDYEEIEELMSHDKKNEGGNINFTLLGDIGDIRINQRIDAELVKESIDFYRENIE
ncbi:MAG: 3-dehydroquinate synthase [Tannerella sp.]|jgi:3-dehydroquinate synthase|nr:3-dehydroquinate synthase [Tannerella sp.]